ncbi:MAG TPA: type II secretion system F family protein [Lacipirellulaceae bacterium]|jgi:general secretion pathway protein F|nr:type II secretion system F family protein [Lacipirellulaceae bacterium]
MKASRGESYTAPTLADFLSLNEEIAAVVGARLPLESQLAQVGAELPAKMGLLADRIAKRLSSGETLPAAIDAECADMPAIYRATIIAGLESGRLGGAIESLVDTASRLDQLRRLTGVALLYPVIIVGMACLLFAFVVTSVIPQFGRLVNASFGPLAWLSHYPLAVVSIAVVVPFLLILVAATWWRRSAKVNGAIPTRFGILEWMPGVRQVRHWSQAATFANILLLLVEGDVPLPDGLSLAADATDDSRLRAAGQHFADRIRQGETGPPATAIDGTQYDFPLLIRLALSRSTNRELLIGSLRHAAELYRERAIRAAEWYAEYMPILLTVGLGGTLTMCFTLSVLWPYASTLYALSGWKS